MHAQLVVCGIVAAAKATSEIFVPLILMVDGSVFSSGSHPARSKSAIISVGTSDSMPAATALVLVEGGASVLRSAEISSLRSIGSSAESDSFSCSCTDGAEVFLSTCSYITTK